MSPFRKLVLGIVFLLAAFAPSSSQEAKYPSRAVTVVVPFTPGTEADILARLYAAKLSERMGYPFVVENRPGASGLLAAQSLLNSSADGHLLLFVSSAFAIDPSIYEQLPFDTTRDFSGIALIGSSPVALVVSTTLGINSQRQFVQLAKERPGQLNFGSAGTGSATYFGCSDFIKSAGIELVGVPYKGVQEFILDIIAGRIQLGCPPIGLAAPQVRAGKLIALSVTAKKRVALLPTLQTTGEAGLQGFEYGIWYGMVASSKTPRYIVDQLANEISVITKLTDISLALNNDGVTPSELKTKDFDVFIATEIEKFRKLARTSGINIR